MMESLFRNAFRSTLAAAMVLAIALPASAQDGAATRPVAKPPARKAAPAAPAAPIEPDADDAEAADEGAPADIEPDDEGDAAEKDDAEDESDDEVGEREAPRPKDEHDKPEVKTAPAPEAKKPTVVKRRAEPPMVLIGPRELEYYEGAAIPPGYVKEEKVRKGLVIGGAVTFGVTWLASVAAATAIISADANDQVDDDDRRHFGYRERDYDDGDAHPAAALYIPLAGPFIAIGTMDADREAAAVMAANGVLQIAGFSMLVAGVAAKKTVLVRKNDASLSLVPGAGTMSLAGTF
jgi:hypothetical protein